MAKVKMHAEGWDEITSQVVNSLGVELMQRVADACNGDEGLGDGGFMVSTEGSKPLQKRSYRATVITVTEDAQRANAKNNTLVNNFHLAADD